MGLEGSTVYRGVEVEGSTVTECWDLEGSTVYRGVGVEGSTVYRGTEVLGFRGFHCLQKCWGRGFHCSPMPQMTLTSIQQILCQMPTVHRRTFEFLISFMKNLLKHADVNGLDPKVLGETGS